MITAAASNAAWSFAARRAHQVDELLVDDPDHLLAGVEPGQHPLADGLLA